MKNIGVKCELCSTNIDLSFHTQYQCNNIETVNKRIKKQGSLFCLFTTFLFLDFGCLSYLALYIANNPLNFNSQVVVAIIILSALSFLGISGVIAVGYFIFDYFITKI